MAYFIHNWCIVTLFNYHGGWKVIEVALVSLFRHRFLTINDRAILFVGHIAIVPLLLLLINYGFRDVHLRLRLSVGLAIDLTLLEASWGYGGSEKLHRWYIWNRDLRVIILFLSIMVRIDRSVWFDDFIQVIYRTLPTRFFVMLFCDLSKWCWCLYLFIVNILVLVIRFLFMQLWCAAPIVLNYRHSCLTCPSRCVHPRQVLVAWGNGRLTSCYGLATGPRALTLITNFFFVLADRGASIYLVITTFRCAYAIVAVV